MTSQAAQLHTLQETNTELHSKLNMAELLTQQLSAETRPHPSSSSSILPDPSDRTDRLGELQAEVERLEGVVQSVRGERDQALGDLDALRDAMIQQQQASARKVRVLHSCRQLQYVQVNLYGVNCSTPIDQL